MPEFGRIVAVVQPEWAEDDGVIDWEESLARWDDAMWSRFVFGPVPFRWQTFILWWIARRYVIPRDPTRR